MGSTPSWHCGLITAGTSIALSELIPLGCCHDPVFHGAPFAGLVHQDPEDPGLQRRATLEPPDTLDHRSVDTGRTPSLTHSRRERCRFYLFRNFAVIWSDYFGVTPRALSTDALSIGAAPSRRPRSWVGPASGTPPADIPPVHAAIGPVESPGTPARAFGNARVRAHRRARNL